jgi:hypothetical protein
MIYAQAPTLVPRSQALAHASQTKRQCVQLPHCTLLKKVLALKTALQEGKAYGQNANSLRLSTVKSEPGHMRQGITCRYTFLFSNSLSLSD